MPRVRALDNYLRTHRKRSGLTQTELAFLLGCKHRSKVSRYERGVRRPSLETVMGFEVVFRVPVAQLFAGKYEIVQEEIRSRARRLSKQLDAQPMTPATKQKLDAMVEVIYPARGTGEAA